jgi:mannose-6-phosphate isomerase-like protein (cupin superfamily)
MPKPYKVNIEALTLKNTNFRRVVYTDKRIQLVVMSLNVGEFIHMEVHNGSQFFRIEEGVGSATVSGKKIKLIQGTVLIVPTGTKHMITNTSKSSPLKLYTVYSPPQHTPDTVDRRQVDD